MFIVRRPVEGMTPTGSDGKAGPMSDNNSLPDITDGVAEPSSTKMVVAIFSVGIIGLLGMFSTLFGWDSLPVISELIPMLDALGGSGIWYYLVGIIAGMAIILANALGEVLGD